jgi:lipopolysaccharide transport system permease protein
VALLYEVSVQRAERMNEAGRGGQAQSLIGDLNPVSMVSHLWRRRELIRQLTAREISARYRGTSLGALWSLVTPLLMLAIYTLVFAEILHVKWGAAEHLSGTDHFALTLFAGLIPFSVFSEMVSRAPQLIISTPNYVKKVVFPLEVLPVVILGSAVVHSLISVGILVIGTVVLLGFLSKTVILLPFVYAPLIFLCLGVSWFLASLGVYIRDIGQVVGLVVQALFFLSPIFYSASTVPPSLQFIMGLNPLTIILTGFRLTLLWQESLPWGLWAAWTGGSMLVAWLGYVWFMKTKHGFADVM